MISLLEQDEPEEKQKIPLLRNEDETTFPDLIVTEKGKDVVSPRTLQVRSSGEKESPKDVGVAQ